MPGPLSITRTAADVTLSRRGLDADQPALGRCVDGVVDQVRPHLVQLARIRRDLRQIGCVVAFELQALLLQLVSKHHQGAVEAFAHVHRLFVAARDPCASRSSPTAPAPRCAPRRRGCRATRRVASTSVSIQRTALATAAGGTCWPMVSRSASVTPGVDQRPCQRPRLGDAVARRATRRSPLRDRLRAIASSVAAGRCRSASASAPSASQRRAVETGRAEIGGQVWPGRSAVVCERLGVAAHGGRRVVQLVRQPRGQRAQRRHLLALLDRRASPRARGRSSSRPAAGRARGSAQHLAEASLGNLRMRSGPGPRAAGAGVVHACARTAAGP